MWLNRRYSLILPCLPEKDRDSRKESREALTHRWTIFFAVRYRMRVQSPGERCGLSTARCSSFEGVHVRIDPAVLRALIFVVLATWCSLAEAQKTVQRVVIHSAEGGLGASKSQIVSIQRTGGGFLSNGRPVSTVQVQSLAAALSAAPLTEPDMGNLGITDEWLTSRVESQRLRAQATEMTAR